MKKQILKSFITSSCILGVIFLFGLLTKDAGDIIIVGLSFFVNILFIVFLIYTSIKYDYKKAIYYFLGILLSNIIFLGLFFLIDNYKSTNRDFEMKYEEIK